MYGLVKGLLYCLPDFSHALMAESGLNVVTVSLSALREMSLVASAVFILDRLSVFT